jgi:uncharacterized iron-regulated protein
MPDGEKNQEMKLNIPIAIIEFRLRRSILFLSGLVFTISFWGCSVKPNPMPQVEYQSNTYAENTVISSKTGKPLAVEDVLRDLTRSQIIYAGEQHTNKAHHEIQLQIIQAAHAADPNLAVGMEMFDFTYQDVLDQWSGGGLDEETFLRKTHWYANWRYDFELYRDILNYIRDNNIRLVALNIPGYVTRKIPVGGIENLSVDEKKMLPERIDLSSSAHREYIQKIFDGHRQHFKGDVRFEDFYAAQAVWEDIMTERIAKSLNNGMMVVLAGNGHIQFEYGVPDRAYRHTAADFRTVYLAPVGSEVDLKIADYIWITR